MCVQLLYIEKWYIILHTDTPEKVVCLRFHEITHPILELLYVNSSKGTSWPGRSSQPVSEMSLSLTMVMVVFNASAKPHTSSWSWADVVPRISYPSAAAIVWYSSWNSWWVYSCDTVLVYYVTWTKSYDCNISDIKFYKGLDTSFNSGICGRLCYDPREATCNGIHD